jgi:tetratricopeptide (TPR) repeat protein
MAIEGPLRELGIHDVFQLLDLSRKTGTLTVTSVLRDNQGTVYFDRGGVLSASIRSNPHRLGELLLRAGKITEGDLTRMREQQRREGDKRQLGAILVEAGALSRKELERQVRIQVEEVVFEMMSWREGFFSFEEGEVADAPVEADIRISTESLLMEGARRIDEWSLIEGKVPHLGVIPVLSNVDADHAGALDLLPKEWEVLAQIDGARDLREISNSTSMSEFDVARVIYGLVTTGIVELRPGTGTPPPPPSLPPRRATPPPRAAEAPEPVSRPEAVSLPGSLLHVPSLEHTGMHRASVMTPPDAAPAAEPVPVPPAAPPPRPARAARTTRLTQTVAREGDDALAHLERAHAALRDGHVDEAVSAATAAVAASNGSVEARIVLSRAQLKAGHVDDALETVSQALERDALNPALYLLLGACAASRGDLADAVAGWERYQRLAPDAPDTSHVRAVADAAARLRDAMKELGDV